MLIIESQYIVYTHVQVWGSEEMVGGHKSIATTYTHVAS